MWLLNLLQYLFYIILFLLPIIYIYFKHRYRYWERKNVPFIKPTIPFGNTTSVFLQNEGLGEGVRTIYTELKKKSSLCGGFFMMSKPGLMIIDPELIKTIFTKDFAYFHDRSVYHDDSDPLSNNLLALKGQKWRNLRAKVTPTFTSGKMKVMFHTILECSNELGSIIEDHIRRDEPLDLRDLFARLGIDTIGSCAFGIDCNSLKNPDEEFRKYGRLIFSLAPREVIINMVAVFCPWILRYFEIPLTRPVLTQFFTNLLKQTIEYREQNNISRKDFLDLMIRLKNHQTIWDDLAETKIEENITFNEIAAQSFLFFGAGFETSASVLNFCMFEICQNQEVQEKIRKEVREKIEKFDGKLTYEAVMEMKYMDKVFDEVLRKYPPIGVLARECSADYEIPNTNIKIEKGTEILISSLGLHRDPDHFPNPDLFDPDRFNEEEKSKRHPFAYLPFGEGPRVCIAQRFALLQVKIVLSNLIKDFKFTLHPKTKTPIKFATGTIFLAPVDTIWVQPSVV